MLKVLHHFFQRHAMPSRVPAPDGGPRAKVSSLRGPDGFPGDFGGFPLDGIYH